MATAARTSGARTPAQTFALVFGAIYVLVGILGFAVTGFDHFFDAKFNEELIVFPLNPAHNVVHLLIGAVWLGASRTHAAARSANLGIGIAYLAVFVLGLLGVLEWLAIESGFGADALLHLASGALGVIFGTAAASERRTATA
jgi:Domain of unknown function (DUF4383)